MNSNTIDNWELLMIRQCKKNITSMRNLARIYAASRALPLQYCNNYSYVNRALLFICLKFGLIRDFEDFVLYKIHPDKDKCWGKPSKSYDETLYQALVGVIANTRVDEFPRYPNPAWFRNKYPD